MQSRKKFHYAVINKGRGYPTSIFTNMTPHTKITVNDNGSVCIMCILKTNMTLLHAHIHGTNSATHRDKLNFCHNTCWTSNKINPKYSTQMETINSH